MENYDYTNFNSYLSLLHERGRQFRMLEKNRLGPVPAERQNMFIIMKVLSQQRLEAKGL